MKITTLRSFIRSKSTKYALLIALASILIAPLRAHDGHNLLDVYMANRALPAIQTNDQKLLIKCTTTQQLARCFQTTLQKNYAAPLAHMQLITTPLAQSIDQTINPATTLGTLKIIEYITQTPSLKVQSLIPVCANISSDQRDEIRKQFYALQDQLDDFFSQKNIFTQLYVIEQYEGKNGKVETSTRPAIDAMVNHVSYDGVKVLTPVIGSTLMWPTAALIIGYANPLMYLPLALSYLPGASMIGSIMPSFLGGLPYVPGIFTSIGATMKLCHSLSYGFTEKVLGDPKEAHIRLAQKQEIQAMKPTIANEVEVLFAAIRKCTESLNDAFAQKNIPKITTIADFCKKFIDPNKLVPTKQLATILDFMGTLDAALCLGTCVAEGTAHMVKIDTAYSAAQALTNLWTMSNDSSIQVPIIQQGETYAWNMMLNGNNQSGGIALLKNIVLSQKLGIVIGTNQQKSIVSVPNIELEKLCLITLSHYTNHNKTELLSSIYQTK